MQSEATVAVMRRITTFFVTLLRLVSGGRGLRIAASPHTCNHTAVAIELTMDTLLALERKNSREPWCRRVFPPHVPDRKGQCGVTFRAYSRVR